jgi:hypothetical protein
MAMIDTARSQSELIDSVCDNEKYSKGVVGGR